VSRHVTREDRDGEGKTVWMMARLHRSWFAKWIRIVGLTPLLMAGSGHVYAEAQRSPAPGPDMDALLRKVDDIRIPRASFSVEVTIQTETSRGKSYLNRYEVLMNEKRDTLVRATHPPNDKGQSMLMKGQDFWVYLPTVDQPVRLTLSQRLIGQVSNGDIARMSFSEDYKATLLRTEPSDQGETAVLELTALGDWVTYKKVILSVSMPEARPLKAEFYAESEMLLKTCEFTEYELLAGAVRPRQLIFHDAVKKGERSVLTYANMQVRVFRSKYFAKEYMQKLG
jgi:outer membrane lipoprotein-sorting protein